MARVNIEDSLFTDNRFSKLVHLIGSRRLALGAVVEAWVVAQHEHSVDNPGARIPLNKWEEQECYPGLIEVGLAVVEGDKIYMKGAEEQFKWLTNSKVNGAKGGRKPASNKDQIRKPSANPRASLANPDQPSSSYSLELGFKNKGEISHSSTAGPPTPLLVSLWNHHGGGLSKVARITEKRRRLIVKRWPDHPESDWIKIIEACAKDGFLSGKNDRGWKATFDWLLRADNSIKVLEGNYGTATGAAVINLNRSWS